MSIKAENIDKEIASEAFLPSLSHEYMELFRALLEHRAHLLRAIAGKEDGGGDGDDEDEHHRL